MRVFMNPTAGKVVIEGMGVYPVYKTDAFCPRTTKRYDLIDGSELLWNTSLMSWRVHACLFLQGYFGAMQLKPLHASIKHVLQFHL